MVRWSICFVFDLRNGLRWAIPRSKFLLNSFMRSDMSMLSVKITFFGFCIVFMDCIYFYQILVHRRFRVFLSWHTMFPFSHSFLFIKSKFFISTACIACIFSVTPRLLWWRSFIRRQGTFGCFSHCWGCQ